MIEILLSFSKNKYYVKILKHQQYWRYIDIRDFESFNNALTEFQPTHIIHLAAMTGMDIQEMSFFDANTIGVENLIKATKKLKILKRVMIRHLQFLVLHQVFIFMG